VALGNKLSLALGKGNTMAETIDFPGGFQAQAISFDNQPLQKRVISPSCFSRDEAIDCAQLIDITDGEGTIMYYPKLVTLDIGDVLFLRERTATDDEEAISPKVDLPTTQHENGIIVQIIAKGTASYPQADVKALFRLTTSARARLLNRLHNEPSEVMDEFLAATFKIRASIVENQWKLPEGRVVSRNVDIFFLTPNLLTENILLKTQGLNINLGDYKGETVEFFGGGFDKVNLITGMKGAGKSHIAKGIISESLKLGMSAIVFDINNEYHQLPNSNILFPGKNLKFRLDRISARALIDMIERIAPFAERTGQIVRAELPDIIKTRSEEKDHIPDIMYLKDQANNIIKARGEPGANMRGSYISSLNALESYDLIMSESEATADNNYIKNHLLGPPKVVSLSSALSRVDENPSVIIFSLGGLLPFIQKVVVDLVIETLKAICDRQTQKYETEKKNRRIYVPIYPTIYFEEAHMYMEPRVIDELIPLIRHYGMNLFFITNTPGALPDSVFRLVDNLIMTQMLNSKDIDQVKNCGLTDQETIKGFARDLPKYHALFLSGIEGATKNFPLVFKVHDFGLPKTGVTRSMWQVMKAHKEYTFELQDTPKDNDR
jgi:Helicase HerA, central domain